MKSPISSVGIIELEGMRKGSARNERTSSTIRMTGKNERAYSTSSGSFFSLPETSASALRRRENNRASMSHTPPVSAVRPTRMAAKSKSTGSGFLLFAVDLEHGEEGFLRNVDAADLFHPLLAFLLLLQELLLAGGVAAVALGQHVLAQRLDRGARDDRRADRGLD